MGPTERELCPTGQAAGAALPWHAVVTKPQHERAVHQGLSQKDLESFCPTYWAVRRWSDRVKRLELPLFPGYVFCRFQRGNRLPALQTPGVRSIVSFGGEIIPVPDEDVDRIRRIIASGCPFEPWPFLKTGQRVRVTDGPLVGLEGSLAELRSTWRVVVNLELLQRSVAVHFSRDQITPLN